MIFISQELPMQCVTEQDRDFLKKATLLCQYKVQGKPS